MMIAVQHVTKHPKTGRLIYRRQFPKNLRHLIPNGTQGVKRSLGGTSISAPGVAQKLADARAEWEHKVAQARKVASGTFDPLDRPVIAYLASLYAHSAEHDDERFRKDLPPAGSSYKSRKDPEDDWRESRAMLDAFDRRGILDHWGEWVISYTRGLGYSFDPSSEAFGDLCEAVAKAACELWLTLDRRIDPEGPPRPAPTREAPEAPNGPKADEGAPLHLLPMFEEYANRRKMTVGVRKEYSGFVAMLIAHVGHDDANRITALEMRAWRDKMLDTPSGKGKPLDPVTVRKRVHVFRSLFDWAVSEGRMATNVCASVQVMVPRKLRLRERSFTALEARTILSATLLPTSNGMAPEYRLARRWIPWLCAYSGARVGEIAQLRKADIREIEGIWAINVTPDAGTVKSKEARLVPLHRHLIDQGFLNVLMSLPEGPIFLQPSRQRKATEGNRHSKKVGERLAEWVRKDLRITDKGVAPNHGWRHLFKTKALEAGIEGRVADAITGHSPDTEGKRYGTVSLKTMANALACFPRFEAAQ